MSALGVEVQLGASAGCLPGAVERDAVPRFDQFVVGCRRQVDVVGAHAAVAERALRVIPDDAAVSATNTLGAHLSERRRIFSFPVLGEAEWVAVDRTRPSYRDEADAPAPFAASNAVRKAVKSVKFTERSPLISPRR